MELIFVIFAAAVIGSMVAQLLRQHSTQKRLDFIAAYEFPSGVLLRFFEAERALSLEARGRVFEALRTYFQLCVRARGRMVTMPSVIVDEAWHHFLLFSRDYEEFCERAFGRMLHHSPAEGLDDTDRLKDGLGKAWALSCAHEGLPVDIPPRMPVLFTIDVKLGIENGRHYFLDADAAPAYEREHPRAPGAPAPVVIVTRSSRGRADTSEYELVLFIDVSGSDDGGGGGDGGGGDGGGGCGGD